MTRGVRAIAIEMTGFFYRINPINLVVSAVLALTFPGVLVGCGQIKLGGGSGPNDPLPSGTIAFQGNFQGLNGQSVSGSVAVYIQSDNTFVVRLNGLTAPSENGLQLTGIVNGTQQFTTPLRSDTGSQNYTTGMTNSGQVWDAVSIHSPTANKDYGTANLVRP
jgi:hypothetical protein